MKEIVVRIKLNGDLVEFDIHQRGDATKLEILGALEVIKSEISNETMAKLRVTPQK